jgi:hypothetical protein
VIKAIGVHRLADASHGNGGGMGLADIVSRRFFEALDLELTWKHMISVRACVRACVHAEGTNDATARFDPRTDWLTRTVGGW